MSALRRRFVAELLPERLRGLQPSLTTRTLALLAFV